MNEKGKDDAKWSIKIVIGGIFGLCNCAVLYEGVLSLVLGVNVLKLWCEIRGIDPSFNPLRRITLGTCSV